MPLNFPSNPVNGQTYTLNGVSYTYNSSLNAWKNVEPPGFFDWSVITNKPDPVITLNSGVSGSATMTDLTSVTINATVVDTGVVALKAPLASPTFTGIPAAPTAAADTNTTQLATTAFVIGQASSTNPSALGSVAVGTSNRYARADHVHPTTGLAIDNTVVHLAGTETITGAKTFSSELILARNDTAYEGGQLTINRSIDNNAAFTLDSYGNTTSPQLRIMNNGATKIWYFNTNGTTSFPDSVSITGALTATTKSFDIEHPIKPNMRLRYGSLEGPENGVYVRGKTNYSKITLPDYWVGLVDEDSITVQLTPCGKMQRLYVKDIVNNVVIIGGVKEEFFYFIQAERKDVEKLVVEY